jgi:hypothetical protein
MSAWARAKTVSAALAIMIAAAPSAAIAFAGWESDSGDVALELRGNFRWNLIGTVPLDDDLPDADLAHTSFIRLVGETFVGSWLFAEVHALQVVSTIPAQPLNAAAFNLARTGERNRTAALRWTQAEEDVSAFLELDRAAVRMSFSPVDLTVGRQPINLATATLFTPNDFFAPFAAQAFFRVYKPGVDAAHLNLELGPFTYLAAYAVLGYDRESRLGIVTEPKADDPVSLSQSSLLGRAVTSVGDFEISLLGGVVADRVVLGGGLQGELFDWLGVRAEGHGKLGEGPDEERELLAAIGVEHRFESSLFVVVEYYFNGAGAADPADYVATLQRGLGDLPYLGQHQLGAGASYEITPLLSGNLRVLTNLVDGSLLLAGYAEYSLLDDALAVSLSAPIGEGPDDLNGLFPRVPTEYGLYPFSASVELRAYF